MMKCKTKVILLLAALILLCCSCGNSAKEKMGRYVEEEVTLPDSQAYFSSLVQEQQNLRLTDPYGEDMVSADGGETFEWAEVIPGAYRDKNVTYVSYFVGAPDGSRILAEYADGVDLWKLITADGEEILLENLSRDGYPYLYYGAGYFYMCRGNEVYRIDPANGELLFLTESASDPFYLVASEKLLFIVHRGGMLLYDLEKKAVAEKQDEVLSSFLDGKGDNYAIGTYSMLLYPDGKEIYILTKNGMYAYELYKDEPKRIIDGGMYSISDVDKKFVSMAVTEAEDKKVFYIYYSDGSLKRYVMDESLPAEPELSLRIYSLYEDGNIRQAVSAFREKYPELTIRYEVGVSPGYGMTEEDALRNLSTELAAGTGPDILIMDDIPFESYAGKGVLEDLGPIRENMTEEEYFLSVIDGFATDRGQYVIPLTFAVPVLGGDAERMEEIGKIESLAELADMLEGAAGEQDNSVIGTRSAEETLRLFSQASMGAWVTKEGEIDLDAVEDFLTQTKRIYDIQMEKLPENMKEGMLSGLSPGNGENTLVRRYGPYGLSDALGIKLAVFPGQPFYAGYLSSAEWDYPLTQGQLDNVKGDYLPMPGQNYGTCLPATLMAMNSASKNKEECLLFLEYVFSFEFQGNVSLNGTPVNKNAYLHGQINPKGSADRAYLHYGYATLDGAMVILEVYWPADNDFIKLDHLLGGVSGVNYCDSRIYEAVIEHGKAVLTGEAGIEEAVDAIEEELEIYLAE